MAEERDQEPLTGIGLMVSHALTSRNSKPNEWIIDSGASSHMSHNKLLFHNLKQLNNPIDITLGNGKILSATARGRVILDLAEKQHILEEVLFVPELAYNLYSISKAAESGSTAEFSGEKCFIRRDGRLVAEGVKVGGLYLLSHPQQALTASDELWHRRLAHLGSQNLRKIPSMVDGVKLTGRDNSWEPCGPCLGGRQSKTPFTINPKRAKGLLDVVHSDVCGKMGHTSLAGAEYFVTFMDSHSHYSWVYPIKHKSDVFNKFKMWHKEVENFTGRHVRVFRTDGGGEYLSTEFKNHLSECGIIHQVTVPRTPEQNGAAERLNRTLVEAMRSMLIDAPGLGKRFWAEAINTATYIKNRSPTVSLPGITPVEAWSGERPNLAHLRVFGCQAYVHIPSEDRGKLDSKSRRCILLGYGLTTKAYRVFDKSTGQVILSRNVKFAEESPISTELDQPEEQPSQSTSDTSDTFDLDTSTDQPKEQSSQPTRSSPRNS